MKRKLKQLISPFRTFIYTLTGRKPWSYGYLDTRWSFIQNNIRNENILEQFRTKKIEPGFAVGFDERAVEYPWIFANLNAEASQKLLDAGSTFNYPQIISHTIIKNSDTNIYTFYPEENNYISNRVSYQFGDLRLLPYKDNYFDQVVCQSTIEHVDMDNSIYGYDLPKTVDITSKSYEYINVINELVRVLKPNGKLLLTFPYGKFDNYGFFQQFDAEMVSSMCDVFNKYGKHTLSYIQYKPTGWIFSSAEECKNSTSYNPHTGVGKGTDGAAHSRSICCIEFIKNLA